MGVIGADKGDGLVRGAAPNVNFKISTFLGNNYDDIKYFSDATKWAYGSVAQNNSWGMPYSHEQFKHVLNGTRGNCYLCDRGLNFNGNFNSLYTYLMNGTTQRTSITEWINSMDQFQNKGVIVWSNPNTNGSTNSQTHGKELE